MLTLGVTTGGAVVVVVSVDHVGIRIMSFSAVPV